MHLCIFFVFSFLKEMARKGKAAFTDLPSRYFVANISSKKKPQWDFLGGNVAQTVSGVLWVEANCPFLSLFCGTKIRHYTCLFFPKPNECFTIFLGGLVTAAAKRPLWPLSSGPWHSMGCDAGMCWRSASSRTVRAHTVAQCALPFSVSEADSIDFLLAGALSKLNLSIFYGARSQHLFYCCCTLLASFAF